jgi:hypothetical protein
MATPESAQPSEPSPEPQEAPSDAEGVVLGGLGDYDDFRLLPRSRAKRIGFLPRRGGLLLPCFGDVARPNLVVLCGWLLASDRTIQRYLDIYRSRGCDVLWFPVHPLHILIPQSGRTLAERVLSITELLLLHGRKLIFHLLSAGAYMFGQMIGVMSDLPQSFSRIRQSMVGLVFDSVVDVVGIPAASADILGFRKGSAGWNAVHAVLGGYFGLTYPLTKARLLKASGNVRALPPDFQHLPQLWMYSEDDRVADPRVIEEVIAGQHEGVELEKMWWCASLRPPFADTRVLLFVCLPP